MWLIVCAPLFSQLVALAKSSEPVAVLCSAVNSERAAQHAPPDSLSACGYCDLAAQPAIVATVALPSQIATVLLATVPILALALFIRVDDYPSGRPRDPPIVF
ncbi:DUF2946 family protein [Pararobbsia alpina]